MPVEIRELIIRAVVSDSHKPRESFDERNDAGIDQEAMIEECVKQVLKILKRKGER